MAFKGAVMITDRDNVATCLEDIEAGANVEVRLGEEVRNIKALEEIPFGFKSAFTTESPPELTPPSSSSESSSQSPIPDWVRYLVGALLLTILAILITVIILTVKVFRL